jgi:hypothetical protein
MSSLPARPLTGKTRPRQQLRRGGVLAVVFIAVSLCAAACGGGSSADPPASQGGSNGPAEKAVAYADCMRAHGVTNYPEPGSTAGAGLNPASPTFQSARAKCSKLSPFGTVKTHATEQQIRQALETTKCMRDHGVPDFPDPIVTSTPPGFGSGVPSGPPSTWGNGPGYNQEYSNGILFKIPSSIANSAAFTAAAEACNVGQQFGVSNG